MGYYTFGNFGVRQNKITIYSLFGSPCRDVIELNKQMVTIVPNLHPGGLMMAEADNSQTIPRFDHQFISEAQLQSIFEKTFRIQLSLDH